MAGKIEAALFDLDGTLLDSRTLIFQSYEHTLKEHDLPVPDRLTISKQMGKPLASCYDVFAPGYDINRLKNTHIDFQNNNKPLINPYDGLLDMLDNLVENKIKLGIVSSRSGTLIEDITEHGIINYFDVIVQGDEVRHPKPHPDGILKALHYLNTNPDRASMAGDSAEDIYAGKSAELGLTIGITHGFGKEENLKIAKADHIVHRLRDIDPIILSN